MKVLIYQNAPIAEVKKCFEATYSLNFRPQELFHRYYRYLTAKVMHAEALGVLELASGEGTSITPALPELYIGGLPTEVSKEELAKEIKALFREADIEVAKVFIHRNRSFGFLTVASDVDADKAIKTLNNAFFLGKRIVVDRKK